MDDTKLAEEHPEAWLKYHKAVEKYRTNLRQTEADEAMKEEFSGVELRDWQEEIVNRLDSYDWEWLQQNGWSPEPYHWSCLYKPSPNRLIFELTGNMNYVQFYYE
jgi:hypothetical protein